MDREYKFYSIRNGASCTAIIDEEQYKQYAKDYSELKDSFKSRNCKTLDSYIRLILAYNY